MHRGGELAAHAGRLPLGVGGVGQRWGDGGLGGFGRRSPDAESRSGQEWDMGDEVGGEAFITGVYFPLLSVLVPKWMEQVRLCGSGDGDRVGEVLVIMHAIVVMAIDLASQ